MKRIKLLPCVLMLVLCIGVLGLGIYAATPATNTITGQITVNSANAQITITAYEDNTSNTAIATATTRAGTTLDIGGLTLSQDTDDVSQVYKDIILVFSTQSTKNLVVSTDTLILFDALKVGTDSTNSENWVQDVFKSTQTVEYSEGTTDAATGLDCFTIGKNCEVTCRISLLDSFVEESVVINFNLSIDVLEASDAVPTTNSEGVVVFGKYPQSLGNSSTLTDTHTNWIGYNPTAGEDIYTYYDIYLGSDGEKYIKSDGSYYKIQPIKWKVISSSTVSGNQVRYLEADVMLDGLYYRKNVNDDGFAVDLNGEIIIDEEDTVITDTQNRVFANNYKYSDLRAFMNNAIYNMAFSNLDKELIQLTEVDNSAQTIWGTSNSNYICENTNDYLFCLDAELAKELGYSARSYPTDFANRFVASYSSMEYFDTWWIGTPSANSDSACVMDVYGDLGGDRKVNSFYGLVPVLNLVTKAS